jgi:hypothetical protein
VSVQVFNVLGQEVITLVNEDQPAGYHDVQFEATGIASRVYLYRMIARPFSSVMKGQCVNVKKLVVLKNQTRLVSHQPRPEISTPRFPL